VEDAFLQSLAQERSLPRRLSGSRALPPKGTRSAHAGFPAKSAGLRSKPRCGSEMCVFHELLRAFDVESFGEARSNGSRS
jgi:hypothetical protein